MQVRRVQFHTQRLNENLDPLNPAVTDFTSQAQEAFLRQTGDPAGSQQMALESLQMLRDQQVASLAYFDVFRILAVLAISLVTLVLLMRRSVAEKGAHVGAE